MPTKKYHSNTDHKETLLLSNDSKEHIENIIAEYIWEYSFSYKTEMNIFLRALL